MPAPSRFSPQDWEATLVACHYHPKHVKELMKLRDDMHDYEMHVHRLATDPNHKAPDPPNVTMRLGHIIGDDAMQQFSRDESPLDLACRLSGISPADVVASLPSEFSRQLDDIGPVEFSFDESKHPRGQPGNSGQFTDSPGEYWRVHYGEFTPDDLHENHKSRVWLDQDDANTRNGLSVASTLDDLVSYFAGHTGGGSSPGRGATFHGTHLVKVAGSETEDSPYEADFGERLIHPKAITSSTPIENTPFLEMLRKEINSRWKRQFPDHEFEFNGSTFEPIRRGTHGWTKEERDALDGSGLEPDELREILSSGPSHEYWDSVEWLQDMFPDELRSISEKLKTQE